VLTQGPLRHPKSSGCAALRRPCSPDQARPELAQGLSARLVVGQGAAHGVPEDRSVDGMLQVDQLVDDHVVHQVRRSLHGPPVEAQLAAGSRPSRPLQSATRSGIRARARSRYQAVSRLRTSPVRTSAEARARTGPAAQRPKTSSRVEALSSRSAQTRRSAARAVRIRATVGSSSGPNLRSSRRRTSPASPSLRPFFRPA
jgi:hypothetical protein